MIPAGFVLPAWATVTWGFLRRFGWLIVLALAVWWLVALVNERNELRDTVAARNAEIQILNGVVNRCRDWRADVERLEQRIEKIRTDNQAAIAAVAVRADEWRERFEAERRKPPRVEVVTVDRVDGETAASMAESGSQIASELADQLRDRLAGGDP